MFKSKVERFKYKKRGDGAPGPGAYNTYKPKLTRGRKTFSSPKASRNVIKKNAR